MTKVILTVMDKSRKVKVNKEEYRNLGKKIKNEWNKAKRKSLKEQWQVIESLHPRKFT